MLGYVGVDEGQIDRQGALVAAVLVHHPHAPFARGVLRRAVAEEDDVFTVGLNAGETLLGNDSARAKGGCVSPRRPLPSGLTVKISQWLASRR